MPGGAWANVPRSLSQLRTRECAALVLLVLCGACAGQGQEEARVEQVCAIPYGWQDERIGNDPHMVMASLKQQRPIISSLLVHGNRLWLGEVESCYAKRHLLDGSFEGVVGPPWIHVCRTPLVDDGRLPPDYHGAPWAFAQSLVEIAVDSHGRTFLLVEPNSRVLVFGPEPEPVLSRRDASGLTYELRGWEKMCYQLRRSMQVLWPEITAVRCDKHDDVFLTIANAPGGDGAARPRIARFNAEFDFVGWLNGQYADLEGCTYEFSTNADGGRLLRRYDDEGVLAQTLSLPIPDTEKEAAGEGQPEARRPGLLLDGRRHAYVLFHEPATVFERENLATTMQRAVRLYEYDATGVLLRTLRLPVVAMGVGAPCVTVDREGTIYYAIYGTLALEVWRIPASTD